MLVLTPVVLAGAAAGVPVTDDTIQVSGIPGPEAVLNGRYVLSGEHVNGHDAYEKDDSLGFWFCVNINGFWSAQPAAEKGTGSAYVLSVESHWDKIEDVQQWAVWANGSWAVVDSISVKGKSTSVTTKTTTIKPSSNPSTTSTADTSGTNTSGTNISSANSTVQQANTSAPAAKPSPQAPTTGPPLHNGYVGVFTAPTEREASKIQISIRVQPSGDTGGVGKWHPEHANSLEGFTVQQDGHHVLFQGLDSGLQLDGTIDDMGAIDGEVSARNRAGGTFHLDPFQGSNPLYGGPPDVDNLWDNQGTVAVMLFSFAISIIILAYIAQKGTALVRSYMYKALSASFVMLISILLSKAVYPLIFFRFEGATHTGFSYTVLSPLVLFTACFLLCSFFGWKSQYSYSRLMVLTQLIAMLNGFMGVFAYCAVAGQVEKLANKTFNRFWKVELASFLGTLVVAALHLLILKAIASKLRQRLTEPPKWIWGKITNKFIKPVPKASRSCWTMCASARDATSAAPEILDGYDWKHYVCFAETELVSVIIAFIFYKACTEWAEEDVPLAAIAKLLTVLGMWAVFFLSALFLLGAARFMILNVGVAHLLKASVTRFFSCTLVGFGTWLAHHHIKQRWDLSQVCAALGLCDTVLVLIYAFSKLGPASRRGRAPASDTHHSGLSSFDGEYRSLSVNTEEDDARMQAVTVGLIVAMPWAEAVHETLKESVRWIPVARGHPATFIAVFVIMLSVPAYFVWRYVLAPKAELPIDELEKGIDHEMTLRKTGEAILNDLHGNVFG